MLAWATVAAVLVLVAFALIRLAWLEPPPAPNGAALDHTDDAGSELPAVTPTYLRRIRIPSAVSGYDRAVVDALLERAAIALDRPVDAPASGRNQEPTGPAWPDDDSGEVLEDRRGDGSGRLDR